MRVLMWAQTFLSEVGGIETLVAHLLPELHRRGHEVTLLTSFGRRPLPQKSVYGGATIHRLPMVDVFYKKDLRQIIRCRHDIEALIDEFQPQVIHIHPRGPEMLFYLQIRQRDSIPSLLTLHNNLESSDVSLDHDHLYGQSMRRATWVSAVSHDSLAWAVRGIPELAPVSSVIENGSPPLDIQREPLPWDPPRLLFAGRFSPQKRLDLLLDAFAIACRERPELQLILAGDGDERSTLEARAETLGIRANILFTGQVSHEKVFDLLNESTLLVLSSDFEGLPMVVLEASQMERPVVATRVGGLADIVDHGETGLLVENGDARALAAAIDTILQDRQRAIAMGRAGRRKIEEQFSISRCVAHYEAIYRRIGLPDRHKVSAK